MYQPDINTYLDAIKQQFDTLVKDNKYLRQENTRLSELNHQYSQKMQFYMDLSKKQSIPPREEVPAPQRPKRFLKMGAGWSIEGDSLYNVSLLKKFKVGQNASRVTISPNGSCIAFISGSDVYVTINGRLHIIDSSSNSVLEYNSDKRYKRYDGNDERKSELLFTPDSESIYVTEQSGYIKKYDLNTKTMSSCLCVPDPVSLFCTNDLLYLISIDRSFRIYDHDKLVLIINASEDLRGPLILCQDSDSAYALTTKNSIVTFDLIKRSCIYTPTNEERIHGMSLIRDLKMLCVCGSANISFFKILPSVRLFSSNENQEYNYCMSAYRNVIFVGQKNGISLYDVKNKKKMRININDCSVSSVSVSTGVISCTESNGFVKVWEFKNVSNDS